MKTISLIFKILSAIVLAFIWINTIIHYQNLPEQVPIHYNFRGEADGFGKRNAIWLEVAIATAIFFLLIYASRKPNFPLLNIPQNIKDNPPLAEFNVSVLAFLVLLIFADINYKSIQNALGNTPGIGYSVPILLAVLVIFIIAMSLYSNKLKNSKASV